MVLTYRVALDGVTVGPEFNVEQEDAHDWVARHHPGVPYTVTTVSEQPNVADLVVSYLPRS